MIVFNQRLAALSPEKRALLEAHLLEKRPAPSQTPVEETLAPLELSFAQKSLWFLDRLQRNSNSYTIPQALEIRGSLHWEALRKSFEAVVQRHETLRTQILNRDGEPMPRLIHNFKFELPLIDLSDLDESEQRAKMDSLIEVEAQHSFDLENELMLRASLLRLGQCHHVLLLNVHHIASDNWSFSILYRELGALYAAFLTGGSSPLPPLKAHYSNYACSQRKFFKTDKFETQLNYWRQQLVGELPLLEMPTDHPRPMVQSFRGARKYIQISSELFGRIRALSQREGVTLYVTLLTAFQTLLHRYTQQTDIIVGSPLGGRGQVETENLIGYFLNTLVLRADLRGEPTFVEMLQRTGGTVLGAFANEGVPFEKLLDELRVPRSPDRNPLFQTIFQFQPTGTPKLELDGTQIELLKVESGTSKMDLIFTLAEDDGALTGNLEYNTDLYDGETVERMLTHYTQLLASITTNPEERISRLSILEEHERNQLLIQWNQTETVYPREQCIQRLFEEQVEKSPEAIALVFGNDEVSYRELNKRANQLAHYLRERGVDRDVLVGICLDRSIELIVGLLAILKAGGAYVPLDANYPEERLAFMLNDTAISLVLTNKALSISTMDVIDPNHFPSQSSENLQPESEPENLAYVLYTSGSTGVPKGVAIPHRAVIRLVQNTNYIQFSSTDVFLQLASISFDASTLEIWGSLLNGARLVIHPPEPPTLEELGRNLKQYRVTTLWLTAGLFHQMIEHQIESLRGLKYLLAGGDVLSTTHVFKAVEQLKGCKLINGYGPTENTTFTCCYSVPENWKPVRSVPIGHPISNTQVYILDPYLQPTPIRVPGELYIGGDGLARSYVNRSELTAEKFLPNPFKKNERLYKTGDKVRYLHDGTIEFLGRLDNQVKIRGFRIELEEIETALNEHPLIRQATVIARQDSRTEKYLAAYLLPEAADPIESEVRAYLEQKLPGYMVPQYFVLLREFPLNPNGKVDRNKLPAPNDSFFNPDRVLVPPRNDVEKTLFSIWREVLGRDQFGVHDNFFELGGHSLLATQVVSRMAKNFNVEFPLSRIFERPTIASLAIAVTENSQAVSKPQPQLVRRKQPDGKNAVEKSTLVQT